jgi:hypothetical protein
LLATDGVLGMKWQRRPVVVIGALLVALVLLVLDFEVVVDVRQFGRDEKVAPRQTTTTLGALLQSNATSTDDDRGPHNSSLPDGLPNNSTTTVEELPSHNRTGFCSLLPPGIMASRLWTQQAHRIGNVTGRGIFEGEAPAWIPKLVQFVSPRFLRLGYQAPPLPETLRAVLEIVYRRIQDPILHPPLKVAVFGGSVTQGRGSCTDLFGAIAGSSPSAKNYECSWVGRMQVLADEFLGPGVVKVFNLASGGTNSDLADPTIQFKLYKDAALLPHGPDVLINSYTTNDSFLRSHTLDATNDTDYTDTHRDRHNRIIRHASHARPCSPLPLVAYMSDYLGNQHDRIVGEQLNEHAIQEVSTWYHTAFVSYAAAVRRLVYANTKERIFSALWQNPRGVTTVDVHFGMQGHFTASWVAAFGALQAVVDYCEDDYRTTESPIPDQQSNSTMNLVERVLPPPLTRETRLSTITNEWKEEQEHLEERNKELCEGHGHDQEGPCSLAFVASPVGTVRNPGAFANYLRPRTMNNDGWAVKQDISQGGWSKKLGWVATKANATATLFVDNVRAPARVVRVYYLKSYGAIWANATLQGIVRNVGANQTSNSSEVVGEFTVEGFWRDDNPFSIAVPLVLELTNPVPVGNRVELQLDVIGGSIFKIVSIMICRE